MFDSKMYALALLAVVALPACTTTTTTLVEPEAIPVSETDTVVPSVPAAMPHHATSVRSVTTRQSQSVSTLPQNRQRPAAQQVLTDQSLADQSVAAPAAAKTDPLTEQYRIDAPEFDPALGEESSESAAPSEEAETTESSEASASKESGASSESAQRSASSSESAQEPATAAPQVTSAVSQTQSDEKEETKQDAGASVSQELSDKALAQEQSATGGLPSSEPPGPAEKSQEQMPDNAQVATETTVASEPPKPEDSAGAEAEKPVGAAGGVNVPTEAPAVSDKTDHSDHDHRYIADQHVEGAEDEPPKKTKSLHWNMQRQVRKVVE